MHTVANGCVKQSRCTLGYTNISDFSTGVTEPTTSTAIEDLFFKYSATTNNDTGSKALVYLSDSNTSINMLQNHPEIKPTFLRYNTVLPSSAPVEHLFSADAIILSKKRHRLRDDLFEKLLLLRQNGTC